MQTETNPTDAQQLCMRLWSVLKSTDTQQNCVMSANRKIHTNYSPEHLRKEEKNRQIAVLHTYAKRKPPRQIAVLRKECKISKKDCCAQKRAKRHKGNTHDM